MFNMSVLNLSAVSGHRRDRRSAPGFPVVCALALLLCLTPAESQAWGSSRSMQTGHRSPSAFRQCLVRFLVDQPPPLPRVRGERQPVPFVRRKVHDREVYLCRAGKAGSLPPPTCVSCRPNQTPILPGASPDPFAQHVRSTVAIGLPNTSPAAAAQDASPGPPSLSDTFGCAISSPLPSAGLSCCGKSAAWTSAASLAAMFRRHRARQQALTSRSTLPSPAPRHPSRIAISCSWRTCHSPCPSSSSRLPCLSSRC